MVTATGHVSPAPGTAAPGAVDRAVPAVAAGELLAVIGPAGADRTSLLLALGVGLRLRGARAGSGASGGVRRRVAMARAYGAAAPDPYDRVGELLDLAGVYAGPRAGARQVGRALTAAGLTVVDQRPESDEPGVLARTARFEHLPAADQLLLAVALALAGAPQVLLVDAVEAVDDGRDGADDHRVWTHLRRIADSGTTVIAACSDTATAGEHAHRTVLLPHGGSGDGAC